MSRIAIAGIFASVYFLWGVSYAARPVGGNTLDEDSAKCTSCHDPRVLWHYKLSVCFVDDGCDHPVGGDYDKLASGDDRLTPAANLNPAIRLPGGRISCRTCHIPYSDPDTHRKLTDLRKRYPLVPDPMLVLDNRENKLCNACHRK